MDFKPPKLRYRILENLNPYREHIEMTFEEILQEIGQLAEENELLTIKLQRFLENPSTDDKPREPEYLVELIRNVFYLLYLLGHELSLDLKSKSKDSAMPQDINVIANCLGEALKECRKLKDAPHLFPSPSMREAFLAKIASLCSTVTSICENEKKKSNCLWHAWRKDLIFIELLGTDYPNKDRIKVLSLMPKTAAPGHPDRMDANAISPWNNWLNNSANTPPGAPWVAIHQKMPRLGVLLMTNKVEEYDALEASVADTQRVARDFEINPPQMPTVGHDYEHMQWSKFDTVPRNNLGFRIGTRKSFDTNGITTIEYMNKGLEGLVLAAGDATFRDRDAPMEPPAPQNAISQRLDEQVSHNVPYFRYSMAYLP